MSSQQLFSSGDVENSIVLKVHHNEQVRKMPLQWQPNYGELMAMLKDTFKLESVEMKYKDEDDDLVWLTNDNELNNAFAEVKRLKQPLRLFLGDASILKKSAAELGGGNSPHVHPRAQHTTTAPMGIGAASSNPHPLSNSASSVATQASVYTMSHLTGSPSMRSTFTPPQLVSSRSEPTLNVGTIASASDAAPPEPAFVGWTGEISRNEAEDMLRGMPDRTFLTRWSSRTSSYVLSYINGIQYDHIAHIKPKDGQIVVCKTDNSTTTFKDLSDYIRKMKAIKVINIPVQEAKSGINATNYTTLEDIAKMN